MNALLTLGVLALFVGGVAARAQCDSLSQMFQANTDGKVLLLLDRMVPLGGVVDLDTVSYENVTPELLPYYEFDWQSDSSGFHVIVDEFAVNGRWIFLQNWCNEKCWNWSRSSMTDTAEVSNAMLSAMSRTKAFAVAAGDTVSLYRDVVLHDYMADPDGTLTFDRWVSAYGVTLTMEVVDAVTNVRIALLDSMAVAASTPDRRPCLWMPYPASSWVVWVAPSSLAPTTAFIRVNVGTSSPSARPFFRCDNMNLARSRGKLGRTAWVRYDDSLRSKNVCPSTPSQCPIVVGATTSPSSVSVTVPPGQTLLDAIRIVDQAGAIVHALTLPTGTNPIVFALPPGLYIVMGSRSGTVVCSRNIWVP